VAAPMHCPDRIPSATPAACSHACTASTGPILRPRGTTRSAYKHAASAVIGSAAAAAVQSLALEVAHAVALAPWPSGHYGRAKAARAAGPRPDAPHLRAAVVAVAAKHDVGARPMVTDRA
jgi:hypothetical protein